MKEFWDQRYAAEEYAYGKKPNAFFAQELAQCDRGKLLLPAEGEGRNAIYASLNGWKVTAFDFSQEARKKALKLAGEHGVEIDYQIVDFKSVSYPENYFDCIALIFVHMPSEMRGVIHKKLTGFLKPGGKIILEAFSKAQHGKSSGGPQKEDLLFAREELYSDFTEMKNLKIGISETTLDEGNFHRGNASVIRLTGVK